MSVKSLFLNPPVFSRSFPFWAWNARLNPEEIRRQIRQMRDQGIGGFFMHSREGLETEYMGEEWKECVLAAIGEAKKLGMYAWLYDEDRWPSGTAGGRVCAGGDEYRCKGLTLEVSGEYREEVWEEKELLAVYAAAANGDDIEAIRRIGGRSGSGPRTLLDGEVCLTVRLEVSGPSEWFNRETPPDNLNPDAVRRFLSLTHEAYYDWCGEEFGKTVPGIFTDEPSLADTHASFPPNRGWIPWTVGFSDYFQDKRGYDPLDLIPYLYFNGEKSRKIRHDYWYTIALRFSESYAKVLGEWCEEHGLFLTGHFLQEDKLGLAARVSGAIMPMYEYEHVPGIDLLRERTEEFMTVKQCVSAAHQLGRKYVLSETYGCTGWDFTFEGQRYVGDWQYVLGINRRCQHLALYSLAGCRKRDYPPSFHYNTSWWEKNHVMEDYFARLGAVLTEGEPVIRILLLHPAGTAWSLLGTSPYGNPVRRLERDVPKIDEMGYRFNRLIETLCFQHFDPDLGDEILLSKYARVEGNCLRVGEMLYRTWILPSVDTLLSSTFELLKEFLRSGGLVAAMQPCAFLLEGEPDGRVSRLWEEPGCILVRDTKELIRILETKTARTIRILDGRGNEDTRCLALQKRTGKDETLFLVNQDRNEAHEVTVELARNGRAERRDSRSEEEPNALNALKAEERGSLKAENRNTLKVEEWNALTGGIAPVASTAKGGKLRFRVSLGKGDSKLFRICCGESGTEPLYNLNWEKKLWYQFPLKTRVSCTMENTLTLDRCRFRLYEEDWSEETEIWEAQKRVRGRLSMRPVHQNGLEQRYRWIYKEHPNDRTPLELGLAFEIREMPGDPVYLALEHPENFEIECNGCAVPSTPDGYLLDQEIKKVKLNGLRVGENRIILRCLYSSSMELEDCYLCGTFGVNRERAVTAMPGTLYVGDWTSQGFYHYAGGIRYHYEFDYGALDQKRIYLELSDWSAVCATALVNDNRIEIPWKAASVQEITSFLKNGRNRLTVEVMGSPRNLFGPLHLNGGKRDVTDDKCFRPEGADYSPDYQVVCYGLLQPPRLYERSSLPECVPGQFQAPF